MQKLTLAVAVVLLAATGCTRSATESNSVSSQTATHNTLSAEEAAAGWQLLFDGTTTQGWRGYNRETFPTRGWRVEEGELVVEHSGTEEAGFGGDIITLEEFENFELSVDFLLTDTANSGIFYRVIEQPDTPIWHNAPEFQLLDDATYIDMSGTDMATHLTGDNYDLHVATTRPTNPIGEWNTARVVVDDARVEHWLNGEKTVEYELWSDDWAARVAVSKFAEYPAYGQTKRGAVGLQDHGHMVRFRNIKIRKLPAS